MTTNSFTPNPWTESSYGPITGHPAKKLASSRVAPLVALARGYWTVEDKETATKFANMYRGTAGVQSLKNGLVRLVSDVEEDLMAMPWFSARAVAEEGAGARPSSYQYRPSTPVTNAEGKAAKYLWFPGQSMVIDLHPATPAEWLEDSQNVLVTEGLIKGDSALTAQLVTYSGASIEELSQVLGDSGVPLTTAEARALLQTYMLNVPAQRRTVIANSASVTTWEGKDADWRKIGIRGRKVIIAFDGDLQENAMVWRETKKMQTFVQREKGEPVLLTLFSHEVATAQIAAGMDPREKVGIDDYLAKLGSWEDLETLHSPDLPDKPKGVDINAVHGDWRVSPQNDAIVEEFVENINPQTGQSSGGQWTRRTRIGGRILSHVESRRPTENEIADGVVDIEQKMRLEDASCEIEIALLDRNQDADDEPQRFRVFGPSTLMSIDPRDWTRHAIQLPNQVLAHPDWPPRKGLDWLSAVKSNRRDEVEQAVAWNTMGWVPVPGGEPAFIVGTQVLAATENDRKQTRVGVNERMLPGSAKFGVIDEWDPEDIDAYKAQVRTDIKAVLDAFIENGFWTNPQIAIAVVCAMLRPTIPKRPGTTIYFVGPKGKGKSWTASFLMRPWQHKAGTWTRSNLPGSAGDTFGAHENSISLAPMWVIDDLAPQSDRRKAEQQASDLENVIRANFNNSSKRRLDGRTMAQRDVANPIAMLAVTAENPPTVPSILDRLLVFNLGDGSFNDKDGGWREEAIERLCNKDGAPARLAAAMIRFWQHNDTGLGVSWADRIESLEDIYNEEREVAFNLLTKEHGIYPGEAARSVQQVASLGLTLHILYRLAKWAGIENDDPMMDKLAGEDGYTRELYKMAATNVYRSRSTKPGAALLKALAGLLRTGKAHLRNPTTAGAPPFSVRDGKEDVGGVEVASLNEALGWAFDPSRSTWVPQGENIGYFGVKDGEQIAMFDTSAAFKAAQRAYPELIPHGQTGTQSWASAHSEELTFGGRTRKDTVANRLILADTGNGEKNSGRLSGVPVLASKLFEAGHEEG